MYITISCKVSFSAKITNCSDCNSSGESTSVILENTKTDEEVCIFSKYSNAFKNEVVKRNLDCDNLKKGSNVFEKDLGRIKQTDPESDFDTFQKQLLNINKIEKNLKNIILSNFSYGAIKVKSLTKKELIKFKYGFLILKDKKIKDHDLNLEGYIAFVPFNKDIPSGRREGRDVLNELGKMSLRSQFDFLKLCKMSFTLKKINSFNKFSGANVLITCKQNLSFKGKVSKFKSTNNIFGVMADWSVQGYKMDISGQFNDNKNSTKSTLMLVFSQDVSKGVSNVIPNYLKAYINNQHKIVSKRISLLKPKMITKDDETSKIIATQKSKELELEKKKRIPTKIQRKTLEKKTQKLSEKESLAEIHPLKIANINQNKYNFENLEKIKVSKNFPTHIAHLREECETTNGKSWVDNTRFFIDKNLFFGFKVTSRKTRIYI